MKAVLLSIGDELLSGSTLDTNSQYLALKLQSIGIQVEEMLTVSDQKSSIVRSIAQAFEMADVVISTGGLGPTSDDQVLEAMAEYFQCEIHVDPEVSAHLLALLEKRNRAHLMDLNKKQTLALKGGEVFLNPYGTASVQRIEKNGKLMIALPGVPYEMKPIVKEQILPFLSEKYNRPFFRSFSFTLSGIPESELADRIASWEASLPLDAQLSYLPVAGRILLSLSKSGSDLSAVEKELIGYQKSLEPLIAPFVISDKGKEIAEVLKYLLERKNLTLSVAESCTGGELSRLVVKVPGASTFYKGGVVAYHIEQKMKLLGVQEKTLSEYGVVSKEVASEMTLGVQSLFESDLAIATTGTAGPSGDHQHKQVGEVYISVRYRDTEESLRLFLPHLEREDFMNFVSQRALQLLVELIVRNE